MISPKRKIHITLGIALLIFICLVVFGVAPFIGRIRQSSQNFASQKAVLELIEGRIREMRNFRSDKSTLRQNLNRIKDVFVEVNSPVAFLDDLERSAQLAGLPMKVYPFSPKVELDDLWLSTGFRVTFGGRVQNCLRFLELLEQSKWLFEILRLNLEEIPEENPYSEEEEFEYLRQGDAFVSLTLKVYSGEVPSPEDRPQ